MNTMNNIFESGRPDDVTVGFALLQNTYDKTIPTVNEVGPMYTDLRTYMPSAALEATTKKDKNIIIKSSVNKMSTLKRQT